MRDFESRVANRETRRQRQLAISCSLTGLSANAFGFATGESERDAALLRNNLDERAGAVGVPIGGGPIRRFVARACQHERARSAAELLVLTRIVYGDFEHGLGEAEMAARRISIQENRLGVVADHAGATADGRLAVATGVRPIRLTGTIGCQNGAHRNDRASGVVMDIVGRFRNNPRPLNVAQRNEFGLVPA